jgi:hypothetical protein
MLLTIAGIAACAGEARPPVRSAQEIANEYRGRLEAAIEESRAEIVWPICTQPRKPGKACGLVADEMLARPFLESFVTSTCKESLDAISDGCEARWRAAYASAVRQRYVYAAESIVDAACQRSPGACRTIALRELEYLAAHNRAVFARLSTTQERILAEHRRAQQQAAKDRQAADDAAEEERALLGAMAGALGGMQRGMAGPPREPTQCSSDYGCAYGQRCVKAPGEIQGQCATEVNEYGNPTHAPPRGDSFGAGGEGSCSYVTDCAPGFRCVKAAGKLTGHCMR